MISLENTKMHDLPQHWQLEVAKRFSFALMSPECSKRSERTRQIERVLQSFGQELGFLTVPPNRGPHAVGISSAFDVMFFSRQDNSQMLDRPPIFVAESEQNERNHEQWLDLNKLIVPASPNRAFIGCCANNEIAGKFFEQFEYCIRNSGLTMTSVQWGVYCYCKREKNLTWRGYTQVMGNDYRSSLLIETKYR
jgi:hypothetical protein